MTLVSGIVRQGFREGNMKAVTQALTTAEEQEGLERLQSLVASVYGNEMGNPLRPFPLGSNNIHSPPGFPWWDLAPSAWFLPLNQRVMLNLQAPKVFNLHPMPQDGSRFAIMDESNNLSLYPLTVMGNGRLIEQQDQMVFNIDGFSGEWVFRADTGNWQRVTQLELTDEFPFPPEFDDMFITMLALRLNPRYGRQISPSTTAAMDRSRSQFRARYTQTTPQPSQPGLLVTSRQAFSNRGYLYGSQPAIGDSGYPYGAYRMRRW